MMPTTKRVSPAIPLLTQAQSLARAEELTKRWMTPKAKGSERAGWEHPQDVVLLLKQRPGEFSEAGQGKALQLAWLHDILEVGRKEDGTPVHSDDLYKEGVHYPVITMVRQLTKPSWKGHADYLDDLAVVDYVAKLVKCASRVCNLRDRRASFDDKVAWDRYLRETREHILPLTSHLTDATRDWLVQLLKEAMG